MQLFDGTGEDTAVWGRVRRSTRGEEGFLVALEFDEPVAASKLLESVARNAIVEVVDED